MQFRNVCLFLLVAGLLMACNLQPTSRVALRPTPTGTPRVFNQPTAIPSITPLPANGVIGAPVAQAPGPGSQPSTTGGQSGVVVTPAPGISIQIGQPQAQAADGQTGVVATPIPGITVNPGTVEGVQDFATWTWAYVIVPAWNTTLGLAISLWNQAGAQAGFIGQFFFCIVPITMIILFVRGYRGRRR